MLVIVYELYLEVGICGGASLFIDLKYLLALPLDDPGFDSSVLCEFRARLIEGNSELLLFEKLLERFRAHKLLCERGKQRTDSTHVLAAVHALNRSSCAGQTFRHALNVLALLRPMLNGAGIKPSNRVHHGQQCAVAGLVIARQRPETARGIVFLFLEDEFGHMQGIIQAELWDALRSTLRSRALVVQGRVQRLRGWKTMVVESVVPITALAAKESEMAYFVR